MIVDFPTSFSPVIRFTVGSNVSLLAAFSTFERIDISLNTKLVIKAALTEISD
jgi:hypothetical protein